MANSRPNEVLAATRVLKTGKSTCEIVAEVYKALIHELAQLTVLHFNATRKAGERTM